MERKSFVERTLYVFRNWPVLPMAIVVLIVLASIFAPLLTAHDPVSGDLAKRLTPPMWESGGSKTYPFGTDENGRDILTRLIYGSRISLMVASTVLVSGLIIGSVIGLTAGYFGGNIDEFLMRLVDFTLAIPFILVAISVVVIMGSSVVVIISLLVVFTWGGFARYTRALTLALKTMDYVAYARATGASTPRIILRHILPGTFNLLMVLASLQVGNLILTEATLSFLGVGVPKPNPSWGLMVSSGRQYLQIAWWLTTMPGLAIFLTVFSVNFIGDWVRDRLDPKLRQI
jgi:peptide/nickel transport system permease protein